MSSGSESAPAQTSLPYMMPKPSLHFLQVDIVTGVLFSKISQVFTTKHFMFTSVYSWSPLRNFLCRKSRLSRWTSLLRVGKIKRPFLVGFWRIFQPMILPGRNLVLMKTVLSPWPGFLQIYHLVTHIIKHGLITRGGTVKSYGTKISFFVFFFYRSFWRHSTGSKWSISLENGGPASNLGHWVWIWPPFSLPRPFWGHGLGSLKIQIAPTTASKIGASRPRGFLGCWVQIWPQFQPQPLPISSSHRSLPDSRSCCCHVDHDSGLF